MPPQQIKLAVVNIRKFVSYTFQPDKSPMGEKFTKADGSCNLRYWKNTFIALHCFNRPQQIWSFGNSFSLL